jgi:hypothetical protein
MPHGKQPHRPGLGQVGHAGRALGPVQRARAVVRQEPMCGGYQLRSMI